MNLLSFFLAVGVVLTTELDVVFLAVGVLLTTEFVVVFCCCLGFVDY